MIRVGVTGLGFMGKMHFRCYKALENAQVVAICDADKSRLENTAGQAGNVAGAEEPLDLSGIELYTDFDKMLAEEKLDTVSITLPTYMHKEFTIKALEAGVNVLCEKPMAMNVADCEEMITAHEKSGKVLQIGHCLRFWPEYVKMKEIVDSGKYGKVRAVTMQRLGAAPTWAWDNWLMAGQGRSGGAIMDLHIHDSDYVQCMFGMPKAVYCRGVKGPSGGYDHVITSYIYNEEMVVTAEGGWMMAPDFGFEMSFNIVLEKGTIVFDCSRESAFRVIPFEGEMFTPEVAAGDGYSAEIEHFLKVVSGEKVPLIITPEQSRDSIKLILAEKESVENGREVAL